VTYAIIKVAGKQYRVREGERLLVDRLAADDGSTFSPDVLLVGGDGSPSLAPDVKVTARVLGGVKGPKVRIGKYKKRTGYRRHTGFRASLTQIEIESIGGKKRSAPAKEEPAAKPAKQEAPAVEAKADAAEAKAEAPEAKADRPKGMPAGYEDMTVAQIKDAASGWNAPMLAAALEYEQAHGKRKGAIAAIESAVAAKEDS
jgi:large subunit ribosomal protein L21